MNPSGLIVLIFHLPHFSLGAENSCYDFRGRAQKCVPQFVNAAFNLTVEATNTCGLTGPQEFCLQTGVTGVRKSCGHICDAGSSSQMHPPYFMTDFNNYKNWTWWQSETMLERRGEWINSRLQNVNLTLSLGKSFDVTYIRIRFHSPRPESFAIYKRTSEKDEWIPYQYYSASCGTTYKLPFGNYVPRDNQDVATCTNEYSDISPLSGGEVPFSTLGGRPDAENFEKSEILQDWVTATDIRIMLTRMNTFGDEIFGDPRVLRSYFYAVDDLAVGARCKCNGHASRCKITQNHELICECQHNTAGPDCNMCKPFYNDRPWARAKEEDAMECRACDCNGMSNECYFDEALYQETGHGGHCTNCLDNRGGIHCQKCLPNDYVDQRTNRCIPCSCDPTGSEDLQCNYLGQCTCKPGVNGQRCDRCKDNYYDFGIYGCRACGCVLEGSLDNQPRCDSETGSCLCKEFVKGQNCDRCKPGYFGLEKDNPYGCVSCFCYGHSSICTTAAGYFPRTIHTDFETGYQGWTGIDRGNNVIDTHYNGILQNLGISAPEYNDMVYFNAPARYLGDQRFSYNQVLSYKLRTAEEGDPTPSIIDVIIEGAGQRISAPFYSQRNPTPGLEYAEYKFRLNEHPDYRWYPQLKSESFISILANITAIKIRATYSPKGVGFIDDIQLDTARRGFDGGEEATWVESCTCPEGYVGQFCESCAPGFKRNPQSGGPFAACEPYPCHGHSDQCDAETGGCEANWKLFGNHYYYFSIDTATWDAANDYCQSMNSNLVEIETAEENTFLQRHLQATNDYWIGLNDKANKGAWVWTSDNSLLSNSNYVNWKRGEPSNLNNEDCGSFDKMSKGEWNDLPCSETVRYICEGPQRKDCGSVPTIPHGSVRQDPVTASVRCNTGYTADKTKLKCLATGEWETATCNYVATNVVYRVRVKAQHHPLSEYVELGGSLETGVKLSLTGTVPETDGLRESEITALNVGDVESIQYKTGSTAIDHPWIPEFVSLYKPDNGGFYIERFDKSAADFSQMQKPCVRYFGKALKLQPDWARFPNQLDPLQGVKDATECKLKCIEEGTIDCRIAYYSAKYNRCYIIEHAKSMYYRKTTVSSLSLFNRTDSC